jgi:hypothetical protein
MEGGDSPFHVAGNWKPSEVDAVWFVVDSKDVIWDPIEATVVTCDSTEVDPETCSVAVDSFVVGLRNHQDQTATTATGINLMNDLLLRFTSFHSQSGRRALPPSLLAP